MSVGNVGEETASTMISIASKSAVMTTEIMLALIRALSSKIKSNNIGANTKATTLATGKQSLKELSAQNVSLDSIVVSNVDIKSMQTTLKKYGVDFSVVKNRATKDFTLFFKGTDVAAISAALVQVAKDADLHKNTDKEKKPLKEKKDKAEKDANRKNDEKRMEQKRSRGKEKEPSL